MAGRVPVKRVLTERQQEFIACCWLGLSNREIAERHYVELRTVKETLREAYHRLGFGNTTKGGAPRLRAALWLIRQCQRETGIRLGERARR